MIQTTHPQSYSDELYQEKLAAWSETGGAEAFALRCQGLRERTAREKVDLLFIPVGNASRGPVFAILGCPAQEVYLLCSRETRATAEEIRASLAHECSIHLLTIDPTDGKDVADKVEAVFETAGCPRSVVCDQTGGKKPTTSTLAGLAAVNNWSLLYVDTVHQPGRIHHETLLWLPNVFETFGGLHRWVARACAQYGAFAAAEAELEQALATAAISKPILRLRRQVRLARLFREGSPESFLRSLGRGRGSLKTAREAARANPPALMYWIIRCLWRERQKRLAQALARQTWKNDNVSLALKEFARRHAAEIRAVKPLDEEFGSGFSCE